MEHINLTKELKNHINFDIDIRKKKYINIGFRKIIQNLKFWLNLEVNSQDSTEKAKPINKIEKVKFK